MGLDVRMDVAIFPYRHADDVQFRRRGMSLNVGGPYPKPPHRLFRNATALQATTGPVLTPRFVMPDQ